MTNFYRKLPFFLLFFGFMVSCYSQEAADVRFYNLFDQSVGIENTDLYQGVLYKVEYRTSTDKTQFFKSKNFVKGAVLYDGQYYDNLDLKYDVFGDRVLMKVVMKAGGGTLILFNEKLERFEIEDRHFIKIQKTEAPEIGIDGFFEISLESTSFNLYTKYGKKRVQRKDRSSIYYDFVDRLNAYVLHYKDEYQLLNSKKDVKKIFPDLKKEIDKFYRMTNRLRKSDPAGFQVALFERIETLLSQRTNKL